jgi:hypothetical protein
VCPVTAVRFVVGPLVRNFPGVAASRSSTGCSIIKVDWSTGESRRLLRQVGS